MRRLVGVAILIALVAGALTPSGLTGRPLRAQTAGPTVQVPGSSLRTATKQPPAPAAAPAAAAPAAAPATAAVVRPTLAPATLPRSGVGITADTSTAFGLRAGLPGMLLLGGSGLLLARRRIHRTS